MSVRLFLHAFGISALLILLSGCESVRNWVPPLMQPYRPDVSQGNIVTQEMVDQLATGMTRDQVKFLLGTPLVQSVFHENRWDYVYHLKRGKGSEKQTRRLTIYFKDERLSHFHADDMPPETMADNLIIGRTPKTTPKAPPKAATEPQITIPANQ